MCHVYSCLVYLVGAQTGSAAHGAEGAAHDCLSHLCWSFLKRIRSIESQTVEHGRRRAFPFTDLYSSYVHPLTGHHRAPGSVKRACAM